jgi:hypothetical protein
MLKKAFLLHQCDDWKKYLSGLNVELAGTSHGDRPAHLERVGMATKWLAHYVQLLRDGHGVHLKP